MFAAKLKSQGFTGYSTIVTCMWLVVSLLVVALAASMAVGEHRHVFFPATTIPLPELCTMHAQLGLDCPGCGLTRSFIYMAHGNVVDALRMHPVGAVVFLFCALQIPAAVIRFWLGRDNSFSVVWAYSNERLLLILVVLCFVQWLIRMAIGYQT